METTAQKIISHSPRLIAQQFQQESSDTQRKNDLLESDKRIMQEEIDQLRHVGLYSAPFET